jgi:hypothetical protein
MQPEVEVQYVYLDNMWAYVSRTIPQWLNNILFNPINVVNTMVKSCKIGTIVGAVNIAALFTLAFSVKEFSKFSSIFITMFIMSQIGYTAFYGVSWATMRVVKRNILKAINVYRRRGTEMAEAPAVNFPGDFSQMPRFGPLMQSASPPRTGGLQAQLSEAEILQTLDNIIRSLQPR